jgi:hypothetical protein
VLGSKYPLIHNFSRHGTLFVLAYIVVYLFIFSTWDNATSSTGETSSKEYEPTSLKE